MASAVAPGNPNLGAMLPYSPLHHVLLRELGFPVVATSGNASDEPICIDEHLALTRLEGIADAFLVHDRPIVRHVDDSIVRVILDHEVVLRRARGYAPLPLLLAAEPDASRPVSLLAVGAHLKNAVALSAGPEVFISQHIGDLDTEPANNAFQRVIGDFETLYEITPETVISDMHPDYRSTRYAQAMTGVRRVEVQHHVAHVLSCVAENEVQLPALGVAWDGTGYGPDGTVWGGEFFRITEACVERIAYWRTFSLPGGDAAAVEPRRAALGLLYELLGSAAFERSDLATIRSFSEQELVVLRTMLARGLNSPRTSSVGRLFDAVASLLNLRQRTRFEGQPAMELEFCASGAVSDEIYPLGSISGESPLILDWAPMIEAILADAARGVGAAEISAHFHNTLAESIIAVARNAGASRIVLSGGCFQNRRLVERSILRLRAEGFQPYWHQRVPPNDGGVALGQIVAARYRLNLK
jgi:hydrogenase maturation protein HypF